MILDACAADLQRQGLSKHQADAATLWIASVYAKLQGPDSFDDFIHATGGDKVWSEEQKAAILEVLDWAQT